MSLNNLTVPELRKQAKSKGIIGYSKLRKAQLVSKLQKNNIKKKVRRQPKMRVHLGGNSGNNSIPLQQKSPPPLPPRPYSSKIEDNFGLAIFETFAKKVLALAYFQGNINRITEAMKENKVTLADYQYILDEVINGNKQKADDFIQRVRNRREFVERSGSGGLPRQIKTAKDWAEAIGEFDELIKKYKAEYDEHWKKLVYSTPELLCEKMKLDKCRSINGSCKIKKSIFGKEKCVRLK